MSVGWRNFVSEVVVASRKVAQMGATLFRRTLPSLPSKKGKENKMTEKRITLEEFKEKVNGAPWELCEFAEEAENVRDCDELRDAAVHYLQALRKFEDELEDREIEVG
jgi:hypothetical protein